MVYFDQHGISRSYDVTVGNRMVTWKCDDWQLAQTNTIVAGRDENILIGRSRMSQHDGAWGDDLSQAFHRYAER